MGERGSISMKRKILYKLRPADRSVAMRDIVEMVEGMQKERPNERVYLDAREFAICSGPRKRGKKKK
jgi:hypothetical protein